LGKVREACSGVVLVVDEVKVRMVVVMKKRRGSAG